MTDTAALSLSNLAFSYPGAPADRPVIDIDSLQLARGEQLLITGRSGSGKSTLLQLIAGLVEPARGEVSVAGQRVHALHGAARDAFRGRHIGMIFQTFNLLHGFSALENVMAALMFSTIPRAQHADRAAKLLSHLGITDHHKTPEQLSVGQQQRVAVARSLACDPVLVLADEPTASLDPENAASAIDLIQSACREKNAALLCVSHDPTTPARFQRVVSLESISSKRS